MEKKYILAIVLLVVMLAVVLLMTGKLSEVLLNPFKTGAEISVDCYSWAVGGCSEKQIPANLLKAVTGEKICSSTNCGEENEKDCKCDGKTTTDEKPFCCIQGTNGEIYKAGECSGKCNSPAYGSGSNSGLLEQLKYKCWRSVSSDKDPLRIALSGNCDYRG